MDLFGKVVVGVVVVIVFAMIIFTAITHVSSAKKLTAQQAETFISNYLKQLSPGAEVDIINVTPSKLVNGSWDVFAGIIYNQTTPCPTVVIEDFDYPATNMLPRTDNVYASNCTIYGNTSIATVRLPAIAIATSYQESDAAKAYVESFGYNGTAVHARFFQNLTGSPYNPKNGTDIWIVNYTAARSNYSLYVTLNVSGNVLSNIRVQK